MTQINWNLLIDTAGTGDFDTNVNVDLKEFEATNGWEPGEHIARPAMCSFVLDNSSNNNAGLAGYYSPGHANALTGFEVGQRVKLQSIYNSTTTTRWVGWIAPGGIEPSSGSYGDRITTVTCKGLMDRAKRTQVEVETQINKRADEIISAIIEAIQLYPPAQVPEFELGYATLGETTKLAAGASGYLNLETGISTFPYALDDMKSNGKEYSLFAILKQLAESENGYIYVNRDGELCFLNRHYMHLNRANDQTVDNTFIEIDPKRGQLYTNRVNVKCKPRNFDDSGTPVLATNQTTITVPAFDSITVTYEFKDSNGNELASTDVITPVPSTDYVSNLAEDGSSADVTDHVDVTAITVSSTKAEVTYTNESGTSYIQPGSQVRGNNKITLFEEIEMSASLADDVIRDFGLEEFTINAKMLDNAADAQGLANGVLLERGMMHNDVTKITILPTRSASLAQIGENTVIGDRWNIIEDQSGVDSDYFIIGNKIKVKGGGKDYKLTYTLAPAPYRSYWILGTDTLGESTYLGF